jgi:hypothetical protein
VNAIDVYDNAVQLELERGHLKCFCAWHEKNFGQLLVMREGPEPATHSICAECVAILKAK